MASTTFSSCRLKPLDTTGDEVGKTVDQKTVVFNIMLFFVKFSKWLSVVNQQSYLRVLHVYNFGSGRQDNYLDVIEILALSSRRIANYRASSTSLGSFQAYHHVNVDPKNCLPLLRKHDVFRVDFTTRRQSEGQLKDDFHFLTSRIEL